MWPPLASTGGCSGALGLWLRGLRCVMVLAEVMGVKGAFGVAFGDRTSSTLDTHHLGQGRTQLRGSRAEVRAASGIPSARVVRRRGVSCIRDSVRPGGPAQRRESH